ncbi:histidine kinase OS=Streptomyces tendae OX=1932 GN=GUR47_13860 PE=4 SV=1 [Streptomyces tendae]
MATALAVGTRYTELNLDVDDRPVQVVDEAGTLVAASEDLERITGTGVDAVQPRPAATRDDGEDADDDNSDASLEAGEIGEPATVGDGTATVDGDTEDYRFVTVPVETGAASSSPSTPVPRSPPNTAP